MRHPDAGARWRGDAGWRTQLPVYSPLTGKVIRRAWAAAIRDGSALARLKHALRRRYGAQHVVLCASGTDALTLALMRGAEQLGTDEVALPAFSCFDVATAAVGAGLRVRLYDVDPDSLAPDGASVERAVAAGARLVVVAPLHGVPVAWSELEAMVTARGGLLVEDAAQGHGARWSDTPVGGLGRLSVLSFGRGKGWTGGGGALLVRDGTEAPPAPAPLPRHARLGQAAALTAQWTLGRPGLYRIPLSIPGLGLGGTRYHPPRTPAAMSAVQAAAVCAAEAAADRAIPGRRRRASFFATWIRWGDDLTPIRSPAAGSPGWLRFPLRVGRAHALWSRRQEATRLGVGFGYPMTLAQLAPLRRRLAGSVSPLSGAETLARELVTLPTHPLLTFRDLERLLRLINGGMDGASGWAGRHLGMSRGAGDATRVHWLMETGRDANLSMETP